ncbi:hypothetical protein EYR36_001851 [Pleurotus pulmonarius]|nr:hypothetical protein EYR36_001851 [Pleurotus pulmonarius]
MVEPIQYISSSEVLYTSSHIVDNLSHADRITAMLTDAGTNQGTPNGLTIALSVCNRIRLLAISHEASVYIFDLTAIGEFPPSLKDYLEDDTIVKIGHGISTIASHCSALLQVFNKLCDMHSLNTVNPSFWFMLSVDRTTGEIVGFQDQFPTYVVGSTRCADAIRSTTAKVRTLIHQADVHMRNFGEESWSEEANPRLVTLCQNVEAALDAFYRPLETPDDTYVDD